MEMASVTSVRDVERDSFPKKQLEKATRKFSLTSCGAHLLELSNEFGHQIKVAELKEESILSKSELHHQVRVCESPQNPFNDWLEIHERVKKFLPSDCGFSDSCRFLTSVALAGKATKKIH